MATRAARWTADDLDRLPEDENRYEVVDGRLLVNPPPSMRHERVISALARLLYAYVDAHGLGEVFTRNDLQFDQSNRVDPDLSVVPTRGPTPPRSWREAPRPVLIVEVLSPSSWRHDLVWKRDLYRRENISMAWVVDYEERNIHVIRPGIEDSVEHERLLWHPEGASAPLVIDLPEFFRRGLRED